MVHDIMIYVLIRACLHLDTVRCVSLLHNNKIYTGGVLNTGVEVIYRIVMSNIIRVG